MDGFPKKATVSYSQLYYKAAHKACFTALRLFGTDIFNPAKPVQPFQYCRNEKSSLVTDNQSPHFLTLLLVY